jgi:hydrogenase maturation protease
MGDMAVGLRVGELLNNVINDDRIKLIDVSMDALSAVDLINREKPDVVILIGAKRRSRPKGMIEILKPDLNPPSNPLEANDLLRPSLDGRVCITDVLNGIRVLRTTAREVWLVECEPPYDEPYIGLSEEGERCAQRMMHEVLNLIRKYIDT